MESHVRRFYAAWILAVVTIAVALFSVAGRARAADGACQTIAATQAVIANVIAKNGGASEMLNPEESQRYLEELNREPPATHFAGERVLYLARPDGRVLIGLVVGTQVCPVLGSLAVGLHQRFLRVAREHGA